jgi:hypothetical protein
VDLDKLRSGDQLELPVDITMNRVASSKSSYDGSSSMTFQVRHFDYLFLPPNVATRPLSMSMVLLYGYAVAMAIIMDMDMSVAVVVALAVAVAMAGLWL